MTGIYLPGLLDWMTRTKVKKSNIKILFYQNFINSMNSTAKEIWNWLGVDSSQGHVLMREKVMSGGDASNEVSLHIV